MAYLDQILTPHGAALLLLMIVSTFAMSKIFSCLGDLRGQHISMESLIPHLRASISSGHFAKAGVAAESDESCTGRLMAAILREPGRDARRMRLIYKINIDAEFRARLRYIAPLKRWAVLAVLVGIVGAASGWFFPPSETGMMKKLIIVSLSGAILSAYMMIFYFMLRRREIEFNDALAAEALNLIDTATRGKKTEEVPSSE